MSLDEFLVLVCPPIVLAIAISFLVVWGSMGNTDEKKDPRNN
ncbi:cytochrome bd oxidase small subunit CydS [Paenibacillus camelliae]|nr:hypothetical protein [Paenibacillus camelliae]